MVVLANVKTKAKVKGKAKAKAIPMATPPAAGPVTFAEFTEFIKQSQRHCGNSRQVVLRRSLDLLHRVGMRTTLDWGMDLYRRYEAEVNQLRPSVRYGLLGTGKQIWGIGCRRGWLPPIPEGALAPNRDPRKAPDYKRTPPPSREDVQGFLNHLSKAAHSLPGQRGYTLAAVAVFTGIRASEAVGVRVDDVDPDAGTIAVGGKAIAYDSAQLGPILKPWLRRLRRLGCEWLFPADNLAKAWRPGEYGAGDWLKEVAAAGFEGMDVHALHRAHLSYVRHVPIIPGVELSRPPRPRGDDRSISDGTMAPIRDIDHDEMTQLMALLRWESATWKGHRRYAIAALAGFKGLSSHELADLRPEDVQLRREKPVIIVRGDARRFVFLDGPELDILRRWEARPDRFETEYYFPNDSLTGRLDWRACSKDCGLTFELRQVAQAVGISGRVTVKTLTKFGRRSSDPVVLGDDWHAVADPELILDGPERPTRYGRKPKGSPRVARRDPIDTRSILATCDPPISCVRIGGPKDPVFIRDVDKGVLGKSQYKIIKALVTHHPRGLARDEIEAESGIGGVEAVRLAIERLREDPDWEAAIVVGRVANEATRYRLVNF